MKPACAAALGSQSARAVRECGSAGADRARGAGALARAARPARAGPAQHAAAAGVAGRGAWLPARHRQSGTRHPLALDLRRARRADRRRRGGVAGRRCWARALGLLAGYLGGLGRHADLASGRRLDELSGGAALHRARGRARRRPAYRRHRHRGDRLDALLPRGALPRSWCSASRTTLPPRSRSASRQARSCSARCCPTSCRCCSRCSRSEMGIAIVVEAILSFVGLSVASGIATWGGMIAEGRQYVNQAWWLMALPMVCVIVAVARDERAGRRTARCARSGEGTDERAARHRESARRRSVARRSCAACRWQWGRAVCSAW